jgi:very-short-patch-repair endonuclease
MRSAIRKARELRNSPTDAERLLWRNIRDSQLNGFKFTRQYSIYPYIVDFCCRYEMLVVEVDGGQQDAERAKDETRTAHIERVGYRVIRFWNTDVLTNLEGVIAEIARHLGQPGSLRM